MYIIENEKRQHEVQSLDLVLPQGDEHPEGGVLDAHHQHG